MMHEIWYYDKVKLHSESATKLMYANINSYSGAIIGKPQNVKYNRS